MGQNFEPVLSRGSDRHLFSSFRFSYFICRDLSGRQKETSYFISLLTNIVAVGAIEIPVVGKAIKISFPVDLEGQIGRSYLILLFLLTSVGSKKTKCVCVSVGVKVTKEKLPFDLLDFTHLT